MALVALAAAAWLLAQADPGGLPPAVPIGFAGGAFAALVLALGVLWKFQRGTIRPLREDVGDLRNETRRANWQLDILIGALRRHGVPVPDEIWGLAPWER